MNKVIYLLAMSIIKIYSILHLFLIRDYELDILVTTIGKSILHLYENPR